MIRVTVLYPYTAGASFDWAYYLGTHIPLVQNKLGAALKTLMVEEGLSGETPGSPASFVALAHLGFDSVPAFEAAFGPHAAEIMADIPNYTAIDPIVQISDVKIAS